MSAGESLRSSLDGAELPDHAQSANLVARAQRGDEAAMGDLLARYQDRLRRIVRIRLGAKLRRHVESMDIVQGTYAVAFRKLGELELESGNLLNWLARVAENQIRDANDYHNAQKRDAGREVALDAAAGGEASQARVGDAIPADQTSPSGRAYKQELRELLDEALSELAPDHREVVLLRDYSDASWEYVREALGRPTVHACQELHRRAWIKLRRSVSSRMGKETH